MKKLLCQVGTILCGLGMLMVAGGLFEGTLRFGLAVPVLTLLGAVAWLLCQIPYLRIRRVRPAARAVALAEPPRHTPYAA